MEEKKESYIDRYGRRVRAELDIGPDNNMSLQQAGLFARRVDIFLNDVKIKSMGFTLPFGSFRTEVDGRSVEVRQKSVVVGGWKKARFRVTVDGEQVLEFFLSKQGSMN